MSLPQSSQQLTKEGTQYPNIVYYNDNHSKTPKCTLELETTLQVTFTSPSTWNELIVEMDQGFEFLAFHASMIGKSTHSCPSELFDAIMAISVFMPNSKNLKIGVIITPHTPLSVVNTLRLAGVQGILLDLNHYDISDVVMSVNAFINGIPYWPKNIIDKLRDPARTPLSIYFREDWSDHKSTFSIDKLNDAVAMDIVHCANWNELDRALTRGPHQLIFHASMLKRMDATVPEIISMLEVTLKLAGLSIPIGVGIGSDTPVKTIKEFKKSGVFGIVPSMSDWGIDECIIGVHALRDRIPYWPKHIIDKLPGAVKKPTVQKIVLTDRQEEVFRLIVERGSSNKVIAKALGITESTVKLHVTGIFKKYGVKNRTQLAVFSQQ